MTLALKLTPQKAGKRSVLSLCTSVASILIVLFTPTRPVDEMTYAEATSTTPSLGMAGAKREGTPPLPRDRIAFFSGIPAVECIKGVLHLYRHRWEPTESSLNIDVAFYAPPPPPPSLSLPLPPSPSLSLSPPLPYTHTQPLCRATCE